MNMGEEVSHLKAHVNTFYNNGALQRASEQPHLKTNQKPSQINKKVGSQETSGQRKGLLTSDIFSYKSLILLCLGCQKALHGLFSPAIVSEC
ncbi:hypothetical protein [Ruegeria sp.]|uniref:hypothetical protein n=1 Tax=Ruegeria sp. TaxID=1879320 RepID=UPI003AFF9008